MTKWKGKTAQRDPLETVFAPSFETNPITVQTQEKPVFTPKNRQTDGWSWLSDCGIIPLMCITGTSTIWRKGRGLL